MIENPLKIIKKFRKNNRIGGGGMTRSSLARMPPTVINAGNDAAAATANYRPIMGVYALGQFGLVRSTSGT